MKQGLLMFSLVMIAVFIGSMIGGLTADLPGLEWLGEGYDIGLSTCELDLHLIVLTFGLKMKFCIAEVIFLLIALLCYPKLCQLIFKGAGGGGDKK
ncbi:MAG: DUF4321 domain-containing protein [Oscillospiraceae bacterium]|nr:DUF4321 domain-containing protein [Oscillospiraceae bacterium]